MRGLKQPGTLWASSDLLRETITFFTVVYAVRRWTKGRYEPHDCIYICFVCGKFQPSTCYKLFVSRVGKFHTIISETCYQADCWRLRGTDKRLIPSWESLSRFKLVRKSLKKTSTSDCKDFHFELAAVTSAKRNAPPTERWKVSCHVNSHNWEMFFEVNKVGKDIRGRPRRH